MIPGNYKKTTGVQDTNRHKGILILHRKMMYKVEKDDWKKVIQKGMFYRYYSGERKIVFIQVISIQVIQVKSPKWKKQTCHQGDDWISK